MSYSFTFSSYARTVQVRLRCGNDIARLKELDRKYWLVLSCPVNAFGPAGQTVAAALDTDKDGRVRVDEILAAIEWLRVRLNGFDRLFEASRALAAGDIASETAEGAPLAKLFARLAPDGELSETTVGGAIDAFRKDVANGDGVVPVTALGSDGELYGKRVLEVTGGTSDFAGVPGVSAKDIEAFDAAKKAYADWVAAQPAWAYADAGTPDALCAAVARLDPKVGEWFLLSGLSRYNDEAAAALRKTPIAPGALADAPLALPMPDGGPLAFDGGINPAYAADMALVGKLADALAGDEAPADALTPAVWSAVKAAVVPFAKWTASKPVGAALFATWAGVPDADEASHRTGFLELIEKDTAQKDLAAAFDDLRRLLVLRVGFLRFLRNFVSAEDLYPPTADALFRVGTLYMDGRSCTLCFPVTLAPAAHAKLAAKSLCCLAYCNLVRGKDKMTVCAVFTAGSAQSLAVGRNGVFYGLDGREWEATLVHLVANPIGLREAFFSPWHRIADAVAAMVKKTIAGKEAAAVGSVTTKATVATAAMDKGKPLPTPPAGGSAMASAATLGIALSFFATAVTGVVAVLTATPLWKLALSVVGLVLIVSLPSVVLTWFRLRGRDLSAVLNASGWALNRRIGLTAGLGRFFTQRAVYMGKRFVPVRLPHNPRGPKVVIAAVLLLIAAAAAGWYFFCPCSPRQRTAEQTAKPVPVTAAPAVIK